MANRELDDSWKQSNQVGENEGTEVRMRSNPNSSVDGDDSHGRCYFCCKACFKRFMTEHNPLPANPTRFDIIDFCP